MKNASKNYQYSTVKPDDFLSCDFAALVETDLLVRIDTPESDITERMRLKASIFPARNWPYSILCQNSKNKKVGTKLKMERRTRYLDIENYTR